MKKLMLFTGDLVILAAALVGCDVLEGIVGKGDHNLRCIHR